MPIYEFECPTCGRFDIVWRDNNFPAFFRCRLCGSLSPKVMSIVNHTFGWRLTERAHEHFAPKEDMERAI